MNVRGGRVQAEEQAFTAFRGCDGAGPAPNGMQVPSWSGKEKGMRKRWVQLGRGGSRVPNLRPRHPSHWHHRSFPGNGVVQPMNVAGGAS